MKVTIRLNTEHRYSVSIPDNSTVEDLRNGARVACPSDVVVPEDFKLIYNGAKLTPLDKSLESFGMVPNDEEENQVILMSDGSDTPHATTPRSSPSLPASNGQNAAPGVSKKSKKKNRCSFKSCSSASLRMVGNCSHCQGKFCAKHRLLEDHFCQGLQYCKDNAHERNAMKLESERTITSKV